MPPNCATKQTFSQTQDFSLNIFLINSFFFSQMCLPPLIFFSASAEEQIYFFHCRRLKDLYSYKCMISYMIAHICIRIAFMMFDWFPVELALLVAFHLLDFSVAFYLFLIQYQYHLWSCLYLLSKVISFWQLETVVDSFK